MEMGLPQRFLGTLLSAPSSSGALWRTGETRRCDRTGRPLQARWLALGLDLAARRKHHIDEAGTGTVGPSPWRGKFGALVGPTVAGKQV